MMSPNEHAGEPVSVISMYVAGSITISLFSLLPTEYVIAPGRRGVDFHYKLGAVRLPQSGSLIVMNSVYSLFVNPTLAVTSRV
jgi:hypothetical protein